MNRRQLLVFTSSVLASGALLHAPRLPAFSPRLAQVPVLGNCDGCENVFADLPAQLSAHARIAPKNEPGAAMQISGRVFDAQGRPAAGIIVYVYHTDASGLYPRASTRHGRLRGWALSDRDGHYRFDSIRPAAYPDANIPEHVHMHVIEPDRFTYYIDDIIFSDDPKLDERARRQMRHGRGGDGLCTPQRDPAGVWQVQRDIHLGRGIAGYPG